MRRRVGIPALIAVAIVVWFAGGAFAGAFEQGMTWFEKGQYNSAAEQFEMAIQEDSTNIEAYKRLGDCYYSLYSEENPDHAAAAIKAYQSALKADPDDGLVRLHLAQIYAWTEDTDNAIKELELLLEKEPASTAAMAELAEIYSWKAETFEKALDACNEIFKIEPNNERAHLITARVLAWKAEHDKSISHYEAILERLPEKDDVRLEYANELSLAGRFDDAVMQYNYLTSKSDLRDQSLIGLAEAYYYAKRYRDASAVVQSILDKDPYFVKAWRLQGMIYAEQQRVNEAVASFKKAIALDPNNMELRAFLARAYAMNEATYSEAIIEYEKVLDAQPDNMEIRSELARFYSYSNNYSKAVKQFEIMLEKSPEDARLRADLVRVHLKAKKYEEAIAESERLLDLEPDTLDYRLLQAEVFVDAGRFDDAIDAYDDILGDKKDHLPAMLGLGWAQHKFSLSRKTRADQLQEQIQGQTLGIFDRIRWLFNRMSESWHFNRAVAVLNEAVEKYPESTEPYLRLAEVYSEHGMYEKSIQSYEAAVQIDPNATDAYLGMAWVYGKMGMQERSIDAIRRAAQIDPSNIDVLTGLGEAYAYQEDVSQAIETLEKALVLRYADLDLHRRLAHLYGQNSRYYDKAIKECHYILEQDPSDQDTRLLLARLYSWTEKFDDSLLLYDRLLADKPNDRDLYLEMMKTKVYSGRSDEVVAEMRQVLAERPNDIDARLALAGAYEVRSDLNLAEEEYLKVLQSEPANGHAHLGLATVYRRKEQYDKAVVEYREVLQTNPDSAEAYYGLGIIDRKNGKFERAISMQKKVLYIEPSNHNALAELSYNHYLLSRQYIAFSGQYHRAWWLLSNSWGSLYGVFGEYPDNVTQIRAILAEDPGNCDLRYVLAQELQDHNRSPEAVVEYRQLLKYCPNHIGGRIALADIYSVTPSTYSYAIAETLEIIKQEPDNYDAHLRLARLYAWSMQYNAAIGQYLWCLKVKSDATDVRGELAQTLSYARRYEEAIVQYEIILGQDPNRDDIRMELAQLFAYAGRNDDAVKEYEIILKHDPNHYEASFALARIYGWDRRYYEKATNLYKKLLVHYPSQLDTRVEYGRLLFERGEFGQAEEAYRNAVELEPNNIEAHMMLGRIYIAQRDADMAIKEFEIVLDMQSDNMEANYYLTSIYSEKAETYDKALAAGLQVLEIEPNNEEVRELVARVYAYNENYNEAAEQYRILLEAKPDDTDYTYQYALNLSFAERYEESIEVFVQLMDKKPDDVKIRTELGLAQLAQGGYFDAIANLEFAVEKAPWDLRARKGLARSYKGAGQIEAAIGQYKRILIIDPTDQEAKDFLATYNIQYMEGAFLDEWFDFPGKGDTMKVAMGPEVPVAQPYLDEVDQAVLNHRIRMAEQLLIHNRVKRARYLYEDLVEKHPTNPYLHLVLGNIYTSLGMWSAAKKEYNFVLKVQPQNQDALKGLARAKYESAPRITAFAGVKDSSRAEGSLVEVHGGSRFTYRFWNQSEAFVEVAAGRHMQPEFEDIDRVSPMLGLKVGLFGEVSLRAEYTYNAYNRIDPTHNYLGAVGANLFDYVQLEGYYYRDDIRQTLVAMEEGVGRDNAGGALQVFPIDRLQARGEYRHSWLDETDNVSKDSSDLGVASLSYTFFNNPWFIPGYMYTYLSYEDQQPNQVGAYWAPEEYQSHAVPLQVMGMAVNDTLMYNGGVIPAYNIVKDGENGFGLGVFGGFDWEVAIAHKLGMDASASWGLEETYHDYTALLRYTYIFGNHTGIWKE